MDSGVGWNSGLYGPDPGLYLAPLGRGNHYSVNKIDGQIQHIGHDFKTVDTRNSNLALFSISDTQLDYTTSKDLKKKYHETKKLYYY